MPHVKIDAALPRPAQGQRFVLIYPLHDIWSVFVDDGERISVARPRCNLAQLEPGTRAQCVLDPVLDALRTSEQIVFLPAGAANEVDLHLAALEGTALGATHGVVYTADLPPRPRRPASAGAGRALVVADPLGDLPGARSEAGAVQDALDPSQWQVTLLTGPAAGAVEVRAALERSELFHFAGHAWFGGPRGWDSELRLADETVIGIEDILALAATPRLVVLSGCETAAIPAGRLPGGISLANAFLASGTDMVLAAVRPVPDRVTGRFMRTFYEAWSAGSAPYRALRDAQTDLRGAEPQADWGAFRLILRTPSRL